MDICKERIIMERKNWRKNHPHGFIARPVKDKNGDMDIFRWKCIIPGVKETIWEGGHLLLYVEFPEEFPNKPPKCQFSPPLPHPNIYPSGTVCLSILSEDEDWKPSITIPTILKGIQELLDNPNLESPAQLQAFEDYRKDPKKYEENIKKYVEESIKKNKI
ncbi:unnamed protein product [Moneuplotes crassus]|uniref:SUMO-conjugating enzyme UBC9 n=1 Tax=Euplotes crassus TaxID=5936 RepID=A0AAD1Y0W8_EUPCR|nr:unnamed protein product [Moneuplotes crassus]